MWLEFKEKIEHKWRNINRDLKILLRNLSDFYFIAAIDETCRSLTNGMQKAWVPWTYMTVEHMQPEEFKPFLRIDCAVVFRYHQLFMNHLVPWYRLVLPLKFICFFSFIFNLLLDDLYRKRNRGQKRNYLM